MGQVSPLGSPGCEKLFPDWGEGLPTGVLGVAVHSCCLPKVGQLCFSVAKGCRMVLPANCSGMLDQL